MNSSADRYIFFDENNVFMKIIRHEITSDIIYEDDYVIAIKDINPRAEIHVLVISKGEYVTLDHLIGKGNFNEVCGFFSGLNSVLDVLGVKKTGYRLVTNAGKGGHQEVMHLHFHILSGNGVPVH